MSFGKNIKSFKKSHEKECISSVKRKEKAHQRNIGSGSRKQEIFKFEKKKNILLGKKRHNVQENPKKKDNKKVGGRRDIVW